MTRLKRNPARALLALFALVSLGGCWDAKELQNVAYITALGVDYENNEYIVYHQMLEFSNVAKEVVTKSEPSAGTWVAIGKGKTFGEALNSIMPSTQIPLNFGQMTAIVYSNRLLARGGDEVYDITNRFRDVRYTKWVFATDDSLADIFSTVPLFRMPPLQSVLHSPEEVYRQSSIVEPISFLRFIRAYNEPGMTVMLPKLAINSSHWLEGGKPHKLLEIDGVYLIAGNKLKGWLSNEEVWGTRLFQPTAKQIVTSLKDDNGAYIASVVITNPRFLFSTRLEEGMLRTRLKIRVTFAVTELVRNVSDEEVIAATIRTIREHIQRTYRLGLRQGVDIYSIQETFYRRHPKQWTALSSVRPLPLNEQSLEEIEIIAKLQNAGKYKLRIKATP
ncbi:Ger(x)C family spore germination protein [Paenibacillus cymbidii]|uniref:Ger(x)C family spore germination protein n=1 Tax=Paenibacillus cymbidii TaxID=1639034 RepID=UPI001081BF44|nr:Ger(x)C family spore germination protein [Paenibacillus cymbidii]